MRAAVLTRPSPLHRSAPRLTACVLWAVLVGSLQSACVSPPAGALLCADPSDVCACDDDSGGAVIVRWRLADSKVGTLLPRGGCCCMPELTPPSELAKAQCSEFGSRCPDSPAWLVRTVQLRVTRTDGTTKSCVFAAPCHDGELSTRYCIPPGEYDLQLVANLDTYDASCQQFACAGTRVVTPPSQRRLIEAGRATNLQAIVLAVNAPPISTLPDPAATGRCSASDGGAD